jgi:hypothetical protein
MKKCGARTKHDGTPCERSPVRGRTRCRLHGGKTLVGTACPHFRSGRYSAYLPERLRARYEQAEADAELLSLRSDVALVDARVAELLARVTTGDNGQRWANLKKAHEEFRRAARAQDVPRMQTTLATVEAVLDSAVSDHLAWGEIAALLEQRRKLAAGEHQRLMTLQSMLTADQAMTLMRAVVDIITRHVADKQALRDIIVEMRAIAERPPGGPVHAGAPGVLPGER